MSGVGPAGRSVPADRVPVVVCTFDEAGNLPRLVPAILAADPRLDVLVIDDDSPDGTGAIADRLAAEDPRVSVRHGMAGRGLGAAMLDGLRAAANSGAGAVVTMDADFSHHPRHLPVLLDLLEEVDVAIGSRYIPGGAVEGWPLSRRAMSRAINVYTRATLGLKSRDCSGAFRAYRGDLLRQVDFDAVRSTGYSFMEEFLYRCVRAGAAVGETPITFAEREAGVSKINAREAAKALWVLGRLGLERRLGR